MSDPLYYKQFNLIFPSASDVLFNDYQKVLIIFGIKENISKSFINSYFIFYYILNGS